MDLSPIQLPNLAATAALAQRLAPHLQRGDMLALEGELGAGKTTFARDLLRVLGVAGEVPSPTFTLLQTYDLPALSVAHFDLYRLKSADDLDELGWADSCAAGLSIIEWPERAEDRMPENYLLLRFEKDGAQRRCVLQPHGDWAERLREIS